MVVMVTWPIWLLGNLESRLRIYVCRFCGRHFSVESRKASLSDRIVELLARQIFAIKPLLPILKPMYFRPTVTSVVCEECLKKHVEDFPTDQEAKEAQDEVASCKAEFRRQYPRELTSYEAEAAIKAKVRNGRQIVALLKSRIGSLSEEKARCAFFADVGLGPLVNEIPFGGRQVKEIRESLKQIGALYTQHSRLTPACIKEIRTFISLANLLINEQQCSLFYSEVFSTRKAFKDFSNQYVKADLPKLGERINSLVGRPYVLRLEPITVIKESKLHRKCMAFCDKFDLYPGYCVI